MSRTSALLISWSTQKLQKNNINLLIRSVKHPRIQTKSLVVPMVPVPFHTGTRCPALFVKHGDSGLVSPFLPCDRCRLPHCSPAACASTLTWRWISCMVLDRIASNRPAGEAACSAAIAMGSPTTPADSLSLLGVALCLSLDR
jgi:hypothetical protein